jgi:hypothetical protein
MDLDGLRRRLIDAGELLRKRYPEQLTGSPIDGRADQYSLAATAANLCCN